MHSCVEAVGFDTPSDELFYIPKRLDSNGVSGPDSGHAVDWAAELNMTRAAKWKGKSCSQSKNLALAFQSLIGSPNRVRTQRTMRATQ